MNVRRRSDRVGSFVRRTTGLGTVARRRTGFRRRETGHVEILAPGASDALQDSVGLSAHAADFSGVAQVEFTVRAATGGDGMHVYVPIAATYSYEQVRTFAEIVARLVIAERPELFTTPRTVTQREKGKVYFDYLQVSWGKTISAPYVLRAHHKAPVATPLRWSEVQPGLSPLDFTLSNVRARFQHLGDIFAPVLSNSQHLEMAMQKLETLIHKPK